MRTQSLRDPAQRGFFWSVPPSARASMELCSTEWVAPQAQGREGAALKMCVRVQLFQLHSVRKKALQEPCSPLRGAMRPCVRVSPGCASLYKGAVQPYRQWLLGASRALGGKRRRLPWPLSRVQGLFRSLE
ncbi:hypothetical protein NDU88_004237 [Pleurodeles waltl]|uniref:Uncharacterized protein n=1 Tax=Pleurodeles waltl TaxID=8319 RepID=A0AAV7KYV9_PLEWA|nr:hypothetical protein NDU88_004237 [Pleurodeles waltl]